LPEFSQPRSIETHFPADAEELVLFPAETKDPGTTEDTAFTGTTEDTAYTGTTEDMAYTGTTEDTAYTGPIAICNTATADTEVDADSGEGADAGAMESALSQNITGSYKGHFELKRLHDMSDLIDLDVSELLKFLTQKFMLPCQPDRKVAYSLSHLVAFFEQICTNNVAEIGLNNVTLEMVHEKLSLHTASLRHLIWCKIFLFLESNEASFLSICEDRPDQTWRRFLVGVSISIIKFVRLPSGVSIPLFDFDSLKSYVEVLLGAFCPDLRDSCSGEVFSTFFGHSSRQEVVYSNQLSMKRYSFQNTEACRKRHEQVLSELMNDECMNPTREEEILLNLLNPNASFPIAQNYLTG
jgi:hypothetical protein